MNTTPSPLIERYVQAVSDAVGKRQRDEVSAEVRSALADAVDGRLKGGESQQAAERAAVTELGDPAVLAAKYTGQPLHLIGPAHYPTYRRLLRTLVLTVVPIVSIVVLLAEALDDASPLDVLGTAIWAAFQVGIQLAFWVTLVFAVLERTGGSSGLEEWTPDHLPAVATRRIALSDTVFSIAVLVLLMVALITSRTRWLITGVDGTEVPVINPDLWTFWLPVLIAILLATVVFEMVKYRIGYWTVALATINTILNLVFAGIVLWLWTSGEVLNPAMTLPDSSMNLVNLIPWVVVIVSAVEIIQGWLGVIRGGAR